MQDPSIPALPTSHRQSLWVGWMRTPPYDFAEYELQLWHSVNQSLCCRGDKDCSSDVTVIPKDEKLIITVVRPTVKRISVVVVDDVVKEYLRFVVNVFVVCHLL